MWLFWGSRGAKSFHKDLMNSTGISDINNISVVVEDSDIEEVKWKVGKVLVLLIFIKLD